MRRFFRSPIATIPGVLLATLTLAPGLARAAQFVRGDANASGGIDISDPVRVFVHLFVGGAAPLECEDAGDSNDSGGLEVSDGVHLLNYLFRSGPAPTAPFSECGADPTPDGLDCLSFAPCPDPLQPPLSPQVDPIPSPTQSLVITVRGTAEPALRVRASGDVTPVETTAALDGRFELDVELLPNRLNQLHVSALDDDGAASAPTPVLVIHDGEPPTLFVDVPADRGTTTEPTVTVAGRIGDRLSGVHGLRVTVNGERAEVVIGIGTNGTFERSAVPLALGDNTLEVVARDVVGNTAIQNVSVTRVTPPPDASRILVVSGNGQSGPVKELLPQPLVVQLQSSTGLPIANKLVRFDVTRSDGALGGGASTARAVQARTGVDGIAQAELRLGTDAGCGNNRVRATAVGIFGEALFCASATPGPASQINLGTGNNQTGEVGAGATVPLRVWVHDSLNGIAGVPVTFTATSGGGLVNGKPQVTVPTLATGHAIVLYTYGPQPGPQRVVADFEGNTTAPVAFDHFALARTQEETTLTGLVLDNADQPLVGATVSLVFPGEERLETKSDEIGRFVLGGFTGGGFADLTVDGATATALGGESPTELEPGSFPTLTFDLTIVPLAANELPSPVTLPRLLPENGVLYDGTSDVELTVEGMEGLRMRVRAGSVTRADGTVPTPADPLVLSLNQVHFDDVPMPFPDGAAPPFAWTLQPGGTHFDPPVEVTYPNMSALAPGSVAYFLSFDHDTNHFQIVGSGQVTDDGLAIVSDPGTGVSTAGWGGACPPYTVTGDVGNCLNITAEKVVGGQVSNGDYLCKNQRELIRMTAHYPQSEECGEGEVTWTITPAGAGEFQNGDNEGDEVIFVQKDDFVSSAPDDVVVTATRGDSVANFRLTVFHIFSESGILTTGDTREFPSELLPVGAQADRAANLMNELISLVGFSTRTYAEGAAPESQPLVANAFEYVEFFTYGPYELWIRLTAGEETGDFFVTFESPQEVLHAEHMTVVDLTIEAAWSRQFPLSDVNRLPGGTGGKGYPYILMATRAEKTFVDARVTIEDVPEDLLSKLLVRLALIQPTTHSSRSVAPVGSSTQETNGNEVLAHLEHGPINGDSPLHYRVVAGFDLDEDGHLQREEVAEIFGDALDYHLRVVPRNAYEFNVNFFSAGAGFELFPNASEFLQAFLSGAPPTDSTAVDIDIAPNVTDHNVGIDWDAAGVGHIKKYVFPPGSQVGTKIEQQPEWEGYLRSVLVHHSSQVRDFFSAAENAGVDSHEFTFDTVNASIGCARCIGFESGDLNSAMGTVSVFGEIRATVVRREDGLLSLDTLVVDAEVRDLYDWDMGNGFGLDFRAAQVQAGYGSLGNLGRVYRTEINIEQTFTDFEYLWTP